MRFRNITSKDLFDTTLATADETVKGASVFPFFNRSGQVKQLMIVLPGLKKVFMVPFEKGLASVAYYGVIRLSMDLRELKSHSDFTLKQIDGLYHYDPNWILSQERFSGYWAKASIKRSNCADDVKGKVRYIQFSNDLSAIDRFVMKTGFLYITKTITPEMLLAPIPSSQPEKSDSIVRPEDRQWQLSPIWGDWQWPYEEGGKIKKSKL
jgi:hypothetical protein